jgi:hypothetical protein
VHQHQSVVLAARLRVFTDDRFKVDAVVGDQSLALLLSHLEEFGVTRSPKSWVVCGGRDVVAAISESFGDLAADLLVEE